jgi:hypothetical protein
MVLLASVVDYPLRTPFVMILFAIGVAWMGSGKPRVSENMRA